MEKVTDFVPSMEVFANDIELHLSMFCEEQNIEDLRKESQAVWNGALRYIRRKVFPNKDILKSKTNINIYNNNIPSNFNAYNYDLVNDICDIYIDLCFVYDKEISIMGFSNLTGIDNVIIQDWGVNERLSKTSLEIYKKLIAFREESLSSKLATGNKNPVGILAILNRHYQWNMPGVTRETSKRQSLGAAELPKLGVHNAENAVLPSDCTIVDSD